MRSSPPVVKVTFEVEKTRVGKEIDYDKLTVEVNYPLGWILLAMRCIFGVGNKNELEHFLVTAEIPFNEISPRTDEPAT